jgi:hypothetical protein
MAKHQHSTQSITGRDAYIMSQALVYAIGHIQNLPREKQEWSNMVDMCEIARTQFNGFLCVHAVSFYFHTGMRVDLFPDIEENINIDRKVEFNGMVSEIIKSMVISMSEHKT